MHAMAVTEEPGVTFDRGFHFVPAEFDDELLEQHGTTALLRFAEPCACWDDKTGNPDPACGLCFPLGFQYDAAVATKVFGPNRKPLKKFEQEGQIELGDAFFTFKSGVTPPHGSRFVLPVSKLVVHDTLTRGREDIFRFAHVLEILQAHTVRRTPPTGTPYENVRVPLVVGDDFTVDLATRRVTWTTDKVPTGGRVVVRIKTHAEWMVWEERDRNEHDQEQPRQYLCKRYDFLLHPRGSATPPRSY